MHIIVVDDEKLARQNMVMAVQEVFPKEEVHDFAKAQDAIDCVSELKEAKEQVNYAFLDIRLRGSNGIDLAKRIKDLSPETIIIFATAYNDYASQAFAVSASGYLLKPVAAKDIKETLDRIAPANKSSEELRPWMPTGGLDLSEKTLCVVTFGKFCASVDQKELKFERTKSKELLALLIDKKGVGLNNAEIEAFLWEDDLGDKRKSSYVQKVISSMIKTLKQAGVSDVIEKHYNYLAIRPEKIKCDLYSFLQGDVQAINSYYGVYLEDYSWAEMTTGVLTSRMQEL